MANNKIIYGDEVLIDLTADTVSPETLLSGQTAHDKSGAIIEGTCSYDSDTSDATVAVAEMLKDKTAYARGTMLTGTMTNNGAVTGTISTKAGQYTIPQGYHDGAGKVSLDATEKAKLIPENIKSGISLFGISGSYGGEAVKSQANKTATPKTTQQTVLPDTGYDYLSQVTVSAIPYTTTQNSAGGTTVTIAGA